MLGEIWDSICEGFDYLIHFEWVGDLKDGTVDLFSNLGEFSLYGFIFGIIMCAFLFFTQDSMLGSFTRLMKPTSAVIITIITYVLAFVVGYFLGKHYQDTA